MSRENIDDDLLALIREYADEHNIPEDLLIELYRVEKSKITMDRRHGIVEDVRETLEGYVDGDDDDTDISYSKFENGY